MNMTNTRSLNLGGHRPAAIRGLAIAAIGAVMSFTAPASEVSMKIEADGATADFTFKANASSRELLLGYGTTDAGTDTNAWAHVVKLADVQAGATSLANVALPAGCGTTWNVARAFLPREVTSLDYVQRGLILQYDAKENAGRGLHDAAPSVWKDLVGTNDLPLISEDAVAADYVQIATNAHATAGGIIPSYKRLFFEAYYWFENLIPWSGYMNQNKYLGPLVEVPNVGVMGYWGTYNSYLTVTPKSADGTTRGYRQVWKDGWCPGDFRRQWRSWSAWMAPTASVSTEYAHYLNGKAIGRNSGAAVGEWTAERPAGLNLQISGGAPNGCGTVNRFRSVRIYDRQLTADEVACNRMVDLVRYEGGVFSSEPVYAPAPLVVERTSTVVGGSVSADITFGASSSARRLYVAYARTDEGTATNLYNGCDYVCDIAAGATSATVTFPASASGYLAARGGYRLALEKPATAEDYVADGLIVQYDAKENAGRGLHDAASSAWKNLVGTNDLPLVAADSVEADAILVSAGAHNTAGDIVGSYKPLMFEAYSQIAAFTVNQAYLPLVEIPNVGLIGFRNQQSAFFIRCAANQAATTRNSGQCYTDGYWNYDELYRTGKYRTMSAYLKSGTVGTGRNCYANGSKIPFKWYPNTNTDTMPSELNLVVGASGISNRFRSIRIYDRELTADEVAFNRKVDVARYEGGVSPIFEWSDFVKIGRATILYVR